VLDVPRQKSKLTFPHALTITVLSLLQLRLIVNSDWYLRHRVCSSPV